MLKMELILYYIEESRMIILSFLILIFIIATFSFFYMRNFNQEKKSKVIFYGLLLQMSNIDIIKTATIIMRTFIIVYATIITKQSEILMCIVMMTILSIIYIIFSFKRIVNEIVSTGMQIAIIYLINIVNNYEVEIENSLLIFMVKTILIIFALILTTYIFFKEVDIISKDRERKIIKNINKEQNKVEEDYNA